MNADTVLKKLRVPVSQDILIMNAPPEFTPLLDGLAYDTGIVPEKKGTYAFVAVFGTAKTELTQLAQSVAGAGKYDCLFWACYPKGTGKIKSDIKRETVWDIMVQIGLRCVTQVAIDDTWSALRARPQAAVGR